MHCARRTPFFIHRDFVHEEEKSTTMAAMMMRSSVRRFAASAGHSHGASSQSALAHEIAEEHHAIGMF